MLSAVQVIHDEAVVHSDLKPANFVLVKGRLKLIDFGISKAIAADTTNIGREQQIGTANYMPPEALNDTGLGQGGKRLMKVRIRLVLPRGGAPLIYLLHSLVVPPTCGPSAASCIKWSTAGHLSRTCATSPSRSPPSRTQGTV